MAVAVEGETPADEEEAVAMGRERIDGLRENVSMERLRRSMGSESTRKNA